MIAMEPATPPHPGSDVHFRLSLPAHPLSVSVARHATRGLRAWLTDERCERLELITSEAVTNALRHGAPSSDDTIEFEIRASPSCIRVRVSDHGPAFTPPEHRPEPTDIGGYGLIIIAQLSTSWQINRSDYGNNLHFTV